MTGHPTIPAWFVDFDGVVNAIARAGDRNAWPTWETGTAHGYPLLWAPPVVDYIAAARAAGVRVTWLTTWGAWTRDLPAVIPGLPELPYLPTPPGRQETWPDGRGRAWLNGSPRTVAPWWKQTAITDAVADGSPFAWTDDDLREGPGPGGAARGWARTRPGVLLAPRSSLGLLRRDLRALSAFFARCGIDVPVPPAG